MTETKGPCSRRGTSTVPVARRSFCPFHGPRHVVSLRRLFLFRWGDKMLDLLRKALMYKRWSNDRLFAALGGLSTAALTAPQPIKFGSLAKTLQHVFDMDSVWCANLEGKSHGVKSRTPTSAMKLDRLESAQTEIDQRFIDYLADQTPAGLVTPVPFRFLDGSEGVMCPSDMLLHVVNHGTYHRGHISDMLYKLGKPSPVTDYPVFLGEMR